MPALGGSVTVMVALAPTGCAARIEQRPCDRRICKVERVASSIEQCANDMPIVAGDELGRVAIGARHVSLPLAQSSIKEPAS